MRTFQAVGMMVELESGLTKIQMNYLLMMLPDDQEFIPFSVSENNSTIWGYMTVECADEEDQYISIIKTSRMLCLDFDNERTDRIYPTTSGIDVFIECENKTVRGENTIRQFNSAGEFVTVTTDKKVYENVLICQKPYAPWMHLLEASNGNVLEIKTEDILSIQ